MATGCDVLSMLCPTGGWIITENDFDSIVWVDDRPRCTKEQFEAGFAQYETMKAEQKAQEVAAKTAAEAKLEALGLTADDLKALGL
jgi:hypothetical protein